MLLPSATPPVKKQIRRGRSPAGFAKSKIMFPLQQRRPLPAAETGRSCWGSGQQDMSAAQGTKWTLGAATRFAQSNAKGISNRQPCRNRYFFSSFSQASAAPSRYSPP